MLRFFKDVFSTIKAYLFVRVKGIKLSVLIPVPAILGRFDWVREVLDKELLEAKEKVRNSKKTSQQQYKRLVDAITEVIIKVDKEINTVKGYKIPSEIKKVNKATKKVSKSIAKKSTKVVKKAVKKVVSKK
jgi:hypothetical protein